MMRLQADVVDLTAENLLPYVLTAWAAEGDGNTTIQGIISLLENWDYKMEANIIPPTIWVYLPNAIRYEVFDEIRSVNLDASKVQVPVLEWVMTESISYYIDDHTTIGTIESLNDILIRALHRAATDLYGLNIDPENWVYGNYHIVYIDHLAGLTYIGGGPQRGGNYTVNVAPGWVVQFGPSRRMIVSYGETPEYYTVYPGGQSQVMFSPHWDDLFNLWYNFDETTQHYAYTLEHNYLTPDAFQSADDGTMIQYIIYLHQAPLIY